MVENERCQACTRWVLPLYIEPYRGHNLCHQCVRAWQCLDMRIQELFQRDATWQEFLNPQPSWFRDRIVKLEKSMLDVLAPSTAEGCQYIRH